MIKLQQKNKKRKQGEKMEKEYTFILPCLNEEKTLEYCIKEIQKTIEEKRKQTR